MYLAAPNCKKCPSLEQATVCPATQEAMALEQVQKVEALQLDFSPTLTNSSLDAVNVSVDAPFQQAPSNFFAQVRDDRSTLNSLSIHPAAKFAVAALMMMHSLSQTPGISSTQGLSQFVISGNSVQSKANGLKLS